MSHHYDVQEITQFSTALLVAAGLEEEKARAVAEILVEGDLMGHTTHGLQLLSLTLARFSLAGCLCQVSMR